MIPMWSLINFCKSTLNLTIWLGPQSLTFLVVLTVLSQRLIDFSYRLLSYGWEMNSDEIKSTFTLHRRSLFYEQNIIFLSSLALCNRRESRGWPLYVTLALKWWTARQTLIIQKLWSWIIVRWSKVSDRHCNCVLAWIGLERSSLIRASPTWLN